MATVQALREIWRPISYVRLALWEGRQPPRVQVGNQERGCLMACGTHICLACGCEHCTNWPPAKCCECGHYDFTSYFDEPLEVKDIRTEYEELKDAYTARSTR